MKPPSGSSMSATAGPSSAPPTTTSFPTHHMSDMQATPVDVMPSKIGRKLCVRHKQMANQNMNEKLQNSLDNLPLAERSAITHLWSTFSNAPNVKRKLILEGILTMCCFSQLSHLSDSLNEIIRIDPFSLLPREVNLRILGYLDAISLGRAAQVSKSWKALADDDLLWRRMCGQHIDRKCEKCGWGLPLLERKRLKVELKDRSPAVMLGVGEHLHGHGHSHMHLGRGDERGDSGRTRKGFGAGGSRGGGVGIGEKGGGVESSDTEGSEVGVGVKRPRRGRGIGGVDAKSLTREVRLTRPWKTVYCERLKVERNWRKGRCTTKLLKGHTDGVMCLQYHTALTSPSYPVLITGSYDRTVRIWNLLTGDLIRVLRGHARAVRCLQFDQRLLFTGGMDGTVRLWNWQAGECLRVLEGHTDGVVTLHYNGYLLATGSADSTIQVWNFRTGEKFVLRGHEDWVNSVVLWDGKTSPGDVDPTIPPQFAQLSKRAVSPGPSGSIPPDDDLHPKYDGPPIDAGTMLFSASDDGTVKLWDLSSRTCVRTFTGHKAQVQSLKIQMVDLTESERDARRRARRSATPPPTPGFTQQTAYFEPASALSTSTSHITSRHSPLLTSAPDGYDALNPAPSPRAYTHELPAEDDTARKAVLVTGSLDGTVKLWDVESGRETATLFGHIEGVWAVDIDALRLASASHDRTVKVWDREEGTCVQTLVGHRGAVTSLQLSDDMIVSGLMMGM